MKRSFVILTAFLLLILSICAVSAAENGTDPLDVSKDLDAGENQISEAESQTPLMENESTTVKEEVEISPQNTNMEYGTDKFAVGIYDTIGSPIKGIAVNVQSLGDNSTTFQAKTGKYGVAEFDLKKLGIGKHKLKITVDSDKYFKSIQTSVKIEKKEMMIDAMTTFMKGSSAKFKIKATCTNAAGKSVAMKNMKLKVKIKIGKKTRVYSVRTNSKGIASVFSVKKLKAGHYSFRVSADDALYKASYKNQLRIFKTGKKTVTLKMDARKKLKNGDTLETFYDDLGYIYKKGVHARSFKTNDPLDGIRHTWVVKAKFFFKNKNTGKVITKTAKTKLDKRYYFMEEPFHKLISGYTPIQTKIWYVTCR